MLQALSNVPKKGPQYILWKFLEQLFFKHIFESTKNYNWFKNRLSQRIDTQLSVF